VSDLRLLIAVKLIEIEHMRAADPIQQVGAQKYAEGKIPSFILVPLSDAGPPPYTSEKGETTSTV